MSPEERIRRAEEIYYRRQSQGIRVSTNSVNVGKTNKISLGKKMIVQIIICVIIYSTFFCIKSYDNIFTQNVINTTKTILNYDVNFSNLYNQAMEYFNNNFNNIIKNVNVQNEEKDDNNSNENARNEGKDENNSNENAQNGEINENSQEIETNGAGSDGNNSENANESGNTQDSSTDNTQKENSGDESNGESSR